MTPDCRQTKIFYPTVDERRLENVRQFARPELNLLIQAGTGHALVAYHISKWTDLDPTCKLCLETEETTEHLFYRCPALSWERRDTEALQGSLESSLVYFFKQNKLRTLFEERSRACSAGPGTN